MRTRDKSGKFTKDESNIDKVNIFPMLVSILLVNAMFGLLSLWYISHTYFKTKNADFIRQEAIERGYAIEDQGHFLWIETRKAIIPHETKN